MKKIQQNNFVRIAGSVFEKPRFSHEIEGENFLEFVLEVRRLSDTFDYVPITISEKLILNKEIVQGASYCIEGEYRSYNKTENEKSKLILHVFAKDIYEVKSIEEESENIVMLTGFVCKTPIFRVTPFKREICDVLVAVNRKNIKSDYIPCIFWGRNARFIKEQPIGTKIEIEGRVQSRIYTKTLQDGSQIEKTAYEISVNKLNQVKEEIENKNNSVKDFLSSNNYKIEMVND